MKTKIIARVFPRKTNATPTDDLAFGNRSPPMNMADIDEIHVSAAFTYDIPEAERLAEAWRVLGAPVHVGGPAYGAPGGNFTPGLYLKQGYVITSRGCPNACWFCSVPVREGALRELPICEGWNVMDDNLLACSEQHIRAVFAMLENQSHSPILTGGLEAKRLLPWHVELIRQAKVQRMYFAYDTPDNLEPLVEAGKLLRQGGISAASHRACCYVLIGYPGDSFTRAESRLTQTVRAGFMPYAMLYRDTDGQTNPDWRKFQRMWIRPQYVGAKMRELISPNPERRDGDNS